MHKRKCPLIRVSHGDIEWDSLIDTGSEISAISEDLYKRLLDMSPNMATLPVTQGRVVGANGVRLKSLMKQILIEISLGRERYKVILIVIRDLIYPMVLGVNFLRNNAMAIDLRHNTLESVSENYELSEERGEITGGRKSNGGKEDHRFRVLWRRM